MQNEQEPAETTQKSYQTTKLGYFGPKSIDFLILTKFHLYLILMVLISSLSFVFENFEPKMSKLGHFVQSKTASFKQTVEIYELML